MALIGFPWAAPGSVHQRQMAAKGEDVTLRPLTIISEVLDPRTRHQLAMAGVHDYVMSNEVRGLGSPDRAPTPPFLRCANVPLDQSCEMRDTYGCVFKPLPVRVLRSRNRPSKN